MVNTDVRVEAFRVDAVRVRIDNPSGLDIQLFAKNPSRWIAPASLRWARCPDCRYPEQLNRVRFSAMFRRTSVAAFSRRTSKGAGILVGTVIDAHGP
jgi:hypothetical protein